MIKNIKFNKITIFDNKSALEEDVYIAGFSDTNRSKRHEVNIIIY